jgi:phosphoribosyl-ATP pyrophosphohydrolase/phosphoribosyl-AMP cyclohydrolase
VSAPDRPGSGWHLSPAGPIGDGTAVRYGSDGLVPVVAQDVADGRVLMVGHADAEAVTATLETGLLHFHSRSRGRLWRKGETSGHVLRLCDLALDCDGDALLALVEPAGPTCHRGTRSCFDADPGSPGSATGEAAGPVAVQGFGWLETLWDTIQRRAADRPAGSYTARLLGGGVDAAGRKVAEEATELLLAAKDDAALDAVGLDMSEPRRATARAAIAAEAADLLYHALVLLAEREVEPAAVLAELRRRHAC